MGSCRRHSFVMRAFSRQSGYRLAILYGYSAEAPRLSLAAAWRGRSPRPYGHHRLSQERPFTAWAQAETSATMTPFVDAAQSADNDGYRVATISLL